MPSQKYNIGEAVYAKWPGSTLYYKGSIVDYDPIDNVYNLNFENDASATNTEVDAKNVMAASYFEPKSPRRRSRSASPGRRRRRSKSPGRKVSLARKVSTLPETRQSRSPARQLPQKRTGNSKAATVALKRLSSEKSGSFQFASGSIETLETHTPKEEVRSRKVLHESTPGADKVTFTMRETSILTGRVATRSKTLAMQEGAEKEEKEKLNDFHNSVSSKFASFVQFFISCKLLLLTMLMPLLFLYILHLNCKTRKNCALLKIPKIPNADKFFHWKSIGYVFGFFIFQTVLCLIPFGKIIIGPTRPDGLKLRSRLNGFMCLFVSLFVFGVLQYLGKFPSKFVLVNFLSIITAVAIYTLFMSSGVFIYSLCGCAVSEDAPSGGILHDFVNGRLRSVRFFKKSLDVKQVTAVTSCISWSIINVLYLLKAVNASGFKETWDKNPSLVLLVAFQLWFVIDEVFFEESLLYSSMIAENVGYSYLFTLNGFIPFVNSVQTKYLVLYPVCLPWYCYVIPLLLQGVDYIVTANQKNILVDGWWGRVRHPNYFGGFMMCTSWGLLCGFGNVIPWLLPAMFLVTTMILAIQDDKKCKKKYGSSWEKYQECVKYKIIPYVF